MRLGELARDKVSYLEWNGDPWKINGRNVQHAADRNRHVLLADIGFVEDELEEASAFLFLLFEELFDLLDTQQAVFDQSVGNAFAKCFNWRHGKILSKSFAEVFDEFFGGHQVPKY